MEQAKSGDADAQFQIGRRYTIRDSSSCLPQDWVKATQWYERAAASGHTEAMVSLGTAYRLGMGVEKDTDRGLQLYRQAAALGEIDAMRRLGTIYYNGFYLPNRDVTEAEKWFRMAYEHGDRSVESDLVEVLKETNPEQWAALLKEEQRRREEKRRKLFGTIAVVVPSSNSGITRPESAVKGLTYKPLKVLLGIPVGFFFGYGIGAVALPYETASQTSQMQVRKQQARLTEVYERYASDVVNRLQARIVQEAAEQLDNQVLATAVKPRADASGYQGVLSADTVLEIETVVVGLQLTDAKKAEALFLIAATYRLIRVKNGELLDEGVLRHSGMTMNLDAWATNNGRALKDEIQRGSAAIANKAVAGLLHLVFN